VVGGAGATSVVSCRYRCCCCTTRKFFVVDSIIISGAGATAEKGGKATETASGRGAGGAVAVGDSEVRAVGADLAAVEPGAVAEVDSEETGESGDDTGCDEPPAAGVR